MAAIVVPEGGGRVRVFPRENVAETTRQATAAELAANAAAAAGNYYPTREAGEASSGTNTFFAHPDGSGGLVYRERTPDGSKVIAEAATKSEVQSKVATADLASPEVSKGAALVTFKQIGAPAIARTALDKMRETVSVKDAGSIQDVIDDFTTEEIVFPSGVYAASVRAISRGARWKGRGPLATKLQPSASDGVAARDTAVDASWNIRTITGIGFVGTGYDTSLSPKPLRKGTGWKAGPDVYSANAEFIGRTAFREVRFENFDICAHFPRGNIGKWFADCQFETANFHIVSEGNPGAEAGGTGELMHAGNLHVRYGHAQGAEKASIAVDGRKIAGSGQVTIEKLIQENNRGICFFFRDFATINGQPGIAIRDCWNEKNGTARDDYAAAPYTVTIFDVVTAPVWGYFENAGLVEIDNTPVGAMTIKKNTHVVTRGCDLSQLTALTIDANCTLTHENARMYSGTSRGLVRSVASVDAPLATDLTGPWFTMPPPNGLVRVPPTRVLLVSNGQQVINFAGTAGRASVPTANSVLAGLPATQRLTINSGEQEFPGTDFAVPQKYILVQYLVRLVSGQSVGVHLNGAAGLFGTARIREGAWRTLSAVGYNPVPIELDPPNNKNGNLLWHYGPAAGASEIEFGGFAVTAWDTLDEAMSFMNGGMFPLEPVATVSDPVGGATIDAEARASLVELIDKLERKGVLG